MVRMIQSTNRVDYSLTIINGDALQNGGFSFDRSDADENENIHDLRDVDCNTLSFGDGHDCPSQAIFLSDIQMWALFFLGII